MEVTRERLARLPKTDLHVHLDGSLRPVTMIELGAEAGVPLPAGDPDALRDHMHVRVAGDLVGYLTRFETTLSVMQTAEALERIAFELAEDAAGETVRYMEVRYAPVLHTRAGLTPAETAEAVLRGLARAGSAFGIRTGVIFCGLRHLSPETSLELAKLAVSYKDRGVVAFDLAGPEYGHPAVEHRAAFDHAARNNLAITVHAGEAFGPASIGEAIHDCHANRIGHGTRLYEDPELMRYINDFRIPLEINLTSNVQTRAAASFESHPVRLYYDQGIVVSLNTDNRLMSGTTMTEEYWRAHRALAFTWEELCDIALKGFESAFLPYREKVALLGEVAAAIGRLNLSEA